MPRTREGLKKAYPAPRITARVHERWPWCIGHALNKCGWRVDPKGWIWCEECYADYLSDPDAYK